MAIYHESLSHWADQNAQKIISQKQKKDGSSTRPYVCASGITPSGTVHIGNFREIISVDLVYRALLDRAVDARFIYSWDDYDVFRKVPENLPEREKFETFLRLPIINVPDPWGKEVNYARTHEVAVEGVLPRLGITPEYLYQTEKYRSGSYASGIQRALEKREEIRSILNEHRTSPLPTDWWPVSVFSKFTGRDSTTVLSWDGAWELRYRCNESDEEDVIDLRQPAGPNTAGVKLFWRVDWPMRWAFEEVDFEPAGKEHHSAGGSFDTAKRISAEVYNYEAPVTFKYDFITIKGRGGKISSSQGNVISIQQALAVYQPEVLRFLFAGTKPNAEFAISFDLDVIKIYEDYDRCERVYYGLEDVSEKRRAKEGRIYELSQTTATTLEQDSLSMPVSIPVQLPFRHLCNLLLIHNGDIGPIMDLFQIAAGGGEWERASQRAHCAWYWLQNHAPEDFRFRIRDTTDEVFELRPAERQALATLAGLITQGSLQQGDKELQDSIYQIAREHDLDARDFFVTLYRVIIGKERGPRLAGFLKTLGKEQVLAIFRPYEK